MSKNDREFAVLAPQLWNSVQSADTVYAFTSHLDTHFHSLAFRLLVLSVG